MEWGPGTGRVFLFCTLCVNLFKLACYLKPVKWSQTQNNSISVDGPQTMQPSLRLSPGLSYSTVFPVVLHDSPRAVNKGMGITTFAPKRQYTAVRNNIFLDNYDASITPNKLSTNSLMFFKAQAIFKCLPTITQMSFTAGLSKSGWGGGEISVYICDRNIFKITTMKTRCRCLLC